MFPTGPKASPAAFLSNFIVIEESIFTGQALQQVCAVCLVLQHFHCTCHPQSSCLVKHTNIIKTQLAKSVETLLTTLAKSIPLIFLNLRSTPLKLINLQPLEQTPASFDSQLIKAEILQYCKGLTGTVKSNHVLVEQSFHSVPSGNEDLKHHTLIATWRFHLSEKHLQNSLQSHWKGPYQILLTNHCATKLQGTDSWIHVTPMKKVQSLTGTACHLVT